ncbi:energy transducer TonB [Palleronia sp. KMU-117]|uniref:energy transducer TonB n=1 Tax=Palleronia sp. KMU-117 TaxID=3434108 RepID=UPI003D737177
MNTGLYISVAGHTLLILFLLFGGLFARDRLPAVAVSDVTVISSEDFAALQASAPPPEAATEMPEPLPPVIQPPPQRPQAETPPERAEPPVTEAPDVPAPAPEAPEPIEVPPADVADTAPQITPPDDGQDVAVLPSDAAPPPADRVATEAAPPPPLEAETAPEATPEVATDAPGEIVEQETDAAAPEEATTEIVTEAEQTRELAPTSSPRPSARPAARPAPPEAPVETAEAPRQSTPEPAPEPAPAPTPEPQAEAPSDDLIAAAVADAVSQATGQTAAPATNAPAGPPLTGSERDAFRISVQRCWVVDVGSEAASVTVVVGVSLNPDGTVSDGSLRMLEGSGGSDGAIRTAFEAARRAILRCGASGFDLPPEKYDQWRDIEMTFNPEGMRLR